MPSNKLWPKVTRPPGINPTALPNLVLENTLTLLSIGSWFYDFCSSKTIHDFPTVQNSQHEKHGREKMQGCTSGSNRESATVQESHRKQDVYPKRSITRTALDPTWTMLWQVGKSSEKLQMPNFHEIYLSKERIAATASPLCSRKVLSATFRSSCFQYLASNVRQLRPENESVQAHGIR